MTKNESIVLLGKVKGDYIFKTFSSVFSMASSKSSPSSSSFVPRQGRTFDVFLSFRGEDIRYSFVDHLYAALVRSGLTVFKDDEMLQRGKQISRELLKAIEESTYAVVVFSKNYANSSWCLGELANIMKCHNQMGRWVLPVFYHVDPSDVRGQKNDFHTAFRLHEDKFKEEMDKVNEWREALTAAASLSGYHISETVKEGEFAFTNKIVQEILGNIQPCGTENNLIDIGSRINKLNSLLDTKATKEVRMVGICGMGGIGKTTIAKALFRRISHKFDGSCFLKDVRENSSSKRDICTLQKRILKDMAHHHKPKIKDPEVGAQMIQKYFCNKKVLLVLDDVDDVMQLDFLAATSKWFGAGSRIIITTRDEHLLSDTYAKYRPTTLVHGQAVELFSKHAFRKNSPPEEYAELSNRAVSQCGGLPLALEVLGSFFRGRVASVWESALNRLARTLDEKIFSILNTSFEGLEDSEKKIFLDIACFFKGADKKHVTRVLESFDFDPVIGISVLIEKSLITFSNEQLDMHDLVREMGLRIVRESYPNSRLWQHEEIHDFIKKNRNLEAIEGIVMPFDDDMGFSANVFENMINLRLLDIEGKFTSCEPTVLPHELRWLRWNWYPFSSLQIENRAKLVGLEMENGEIEDLWMGKKDMQSLKFLRFEELNSLKTFPDISRAPNLEGLILSNCNNLEEVHKSLGSHRKLVYLEMRGCGRLKCLPSRLEMKSMETLDLSGCRSLENFPEVSPCMVKLSNIYLNDCTNLKNIPNSIGELKHLKSLHLRNCTELQKLPKELGRMENLQELWLGYTSSSQAPILRKSKSINFQTLTTLCCLRKLDLSRRKIKHIDFPNNLDAFSSLEELHLNGNSKLVKLPASISRLSRLKHIELNDCQKLQNIEALPSGIQVLRASNCEALEKIGDLIKEYVWLYKIWLNGCEKLRGNQENKRCLDKMLRQSFVEKCAAVDHRLSIFIPGSMIPSWFKEQQYKSIIALKLPPGWQTRIMGFAVCGLYRHGWYSSFYDVTSVGFRFKNNAPLKFMSKNYSFCEIDRSDEDRSLWIVYIPFSLFPQQMYDDDFEEEIGSHLVEGTLVIEMGGYENVIRCGAHILYKEGVEDFQRNETYIPDYRNSDHVERYNNTFEYIEYQRSIDQ